MQRELAFAQLVQAVQACRRCPRMESRTRVLGPANGSVFSRILFVAEAPGRLGADACGIPLSGDRTGRTFEELLGAAGLSRREIFITNAVLCNPRDQAGRNDQPTRTEIANCGQHLRELIRILDPEWVVSLGNVALQALARLAPHECLLRRDVAKPVLWFDRWLLPLYHPGPQALLHRSLEVQRADYARLGELVRERSDHQVGSTPRESAGRAR
jgi:uracil-DNA glycosylase family 4